MQKKAKDSIKHLSWKNSCNELVDIFNTEVISLEKISANPICLKLLPILPS